MVDFELDGALTPRRDRVGRCATQLVTSRRHRVQQIHPIGTAGAAVPPNRDLL
jgi:hypothetical protein